MNGLAPIAAAALLLACASSGPLPGMPETTVSVDPAEAAAFRQRVDAFYARLLKRRFNTLDTFNDPGLREHFRSVDLFFDYYADFAEDLAEAHFEKSRPLEYEIEELAFETERRAFVQVRVVGADGRPLRPGKTAIVRVDLWEQAEGAWWLTPGKL